jgi:hypothetical protein
VRKALLFSLELVHILAYKQQQLFCVSHFRALLVNEVSGDLHGNLKVVETFLHARAVVLLTTGQCVYY